MNKLTNPPLIEAIFELKWGEVNPGKFHFTQEEQQLLVGKLNILAAEKDYKIVKYLDFPQVPHAVTHRFLEKENTWPCLQMGLGIFTVNQVKQGYSWSTFKDTILEGLDIFDRAHETGLKGILRTAYVGLRYQDAFYPSDEGKSVEEYLREHFNVQIELPEDFLASEKISNSFDNINTNFNFKTIDPVGNIKIMITDAIINGKPGLLMDTVLESKLQDIIENEDEIIDEFIEWAEKAHDIQEHTFKTLISTSAYKGEE